MYKGKKEEEEEEREGGERRRRGAIIVIHLILKTNMQGKYCYHPQFTDGKTKAWRPDNLPNIAQVVNGRTGTESMQSCFRVSALNIRILSYYL